MTGAGAVRCSPEKERLRRQRGWYFYDWANSAFSTTAVTLFLGPYLTALAKSAAGADGLIRPLGIPVEPRSYWGYLVALSVGLQVLLLPLVGAIADATGRKRPLLALFAYLGSFATMALLFTGDGQYLAAGGLFVLANLSFGASVVVYNAFLPEIALPEERDLVSSRGWGLGYLGGGLLLAFNLAFYSNARHFGIGEAEAVRISLLSAGLWWAAFTLIPLATLRGSAPTGTAFPQTRPQAGRRELLATLRCLRRQPQALLFLASYMLYNDAVQGVIALAAQFGNDELGIPMDKLTGVILMVQFVAFLGALAFGKLASWLGAKPALSLSLVIWTGVLIAMYAAVKSYTGFFASAAVVALVLGGSQALSRSLFSRMIPRGFEAQYFSLYEITDKGTSWLAPLAFGLALQFTKNYRLAVLSLIFFFISGLALLLMVNVHRAEQQAAAAARPTADSPLPGVRLES